MTDVLTPEQRHRNMSHIRARDTRPEITVRRLLRSLGYYYRLHDKKLPGKPDIVFKSKKKIIFVHGCFWHMHSCQYGKVQPSTNTAFWKEKREQTVERDLRQQKELKEQGWDVLTIWECESKNKPEMIVKLIIFLEIRQ
jgi:DNA mismatch endonuclease (patch repair protein)